ncbi:protein necessary for structural stability of L-A double-stranded RNA-containing particles [Spathaspora passalidarum NRRL Y-27907]|uniref:Protein necessary for structural stability of L-A double-stranded RNA-containing particles n=1 Tax=Spathaspora passalidarum (strain NRRL Y-27907 / 11-Y1) TaxID=619300 RepID=G3AFC0_SPAPN|nr:protein necessary for structural stability of L-A double-stranded RNA-containing particles [Spathaspora passalidarum NRRL Y-27907]EGW34909.1 protein necessary for structural stability of L-A double-stranded RNA-containing particles [Spathaspora passalidarum NRRL Y-27907]
MSTILATLGMFIIDEIQYPPSWNKPPVLDQIGGAGPYAIMGARIIATSKYSNSISGIIDRGTDFPESIEQEIQSWSTGVIIRDCKDRLTTHGVNVYNEDEVRSFYYKSPKKQIEVDDVLQFEQLESSKCYHLICSISRCEEIIDRLNKHNQSREAKIFIYEPLPDDCKSENLDRLKRVLPKIHIFTPNLEEAGELLKSTNANYPDELAEEFNQWLQLPDSGTVIRCGKLGCHIRTKDGRTYDLPAYHQNQDNVVDVTGGGNSFCGGFIMGYYLSGGNWQVAGIAGNIASGCIIEQLGMPKVNSDLINRKSLSERLDIYKSQNPNFSEISFTWV